MDRGDVLVAGGAHPLSAPGFGQPLSRTLIPDGLNDGHRLGRRVQLERVPEDSRESLIEADRCGPVPGSCQRLDESPDLVLVRPDEPHGPLSHALAVGNPPLPQVPMSQRPRPAGGQLAQSLPLECEPPIELRTPHQEERRQEVTPVKAQPPLQILSLDGLLKLRRVARELLKVQPDLLVTTRQDQILSE